MSQNDSPRKLPINLEQALSATPLTYLVPTQNLSTLTNFTDVNIPITGTLNLPPSSSDPPNQHWIEALEQDLSNDYNVSSIKFRDDLHNFGEEQHSGSRSLFDGLSPSARQIINSLHPNDLQNRVDEATVPQEAYQQNPQRNIRPHPLSELKLQTSTVQFVPQDSTKHMLGSPKQEASIQVKKRKSDIGVQQDLMRQLSLTKLSDLVGKKIGLTNEEAEYEHSDLWWEWPQGGFHLSNYALLQIDEGLSQLIDTPMINSIPLEVLNRILLLASNSIKATRDMGWEGLDRSANSATLRYAENALFAARLVLKIFNSQRNEKTLELDVYLVEVLSFIYTFVEDYALNLISMENEDSKLLNNNLNVTCEIFSQFRTYIPKHQISDTLITKIEYLTILIIFSDVDKAFLYFKLGSSALLSSIFQSKRSQRSFIIDEILNNFDSLPTHRTTSRQLVTHRDYSIQIFTYLILGLIESINITNKDHDIILPSRFPEAGSDQFKEVIEELNKLTEPFEEIKSEVDSTLNAISSSLINKIIKNPITAMRQRFHLFVTDLINIVKFPEFPAAESLLTTIMGSLLSMSDTQQSIVESYFLEIIGIIGSTILEIRGLEESRCANGARLLVNEKSIVYQYLSSRVNTKGSKDTADFFISNWIFSIMNHLDDDKLQYVELYHGLIRGLQQGSFNSLFPRLEGASNSLQHQASLDYVHILRTSSFIGLYDSFLNRLLKYVDHPKIKSRTRALKNLALLVNRDLALLNVPQVRQSISSKIKDPSPLVRLAVLEIFDEYLLKKPEQLKELYQSVILTSDKSTAVRIKSLKISDRIYRDTKDKEIKLYIIEKIFKRLEDDEETVLDLAQNTIIQLLFLSIAPSDGNQLNLKESVDSSIEIILAYINKSEKNWELFENFLLTMVLRETALNQPIHKEILRITNIMIQNLFNFVIDNMDTELSVSQRLGLLSIIAKYDSPLISQEQLLSLQIYFTSDNCGTDISLYSLMILRQTISNVVSLRAEFLEDCEASLLKRLTKLNSRELSQAVPSLHHISVLKNESSKLANAAASCLSLINPYISKASKGELKNVDPRCTRLLFLIGNFAKECNFEKDRSFFETKKLLALKDKESVVSFMVKNLVVFTRPNVNDQIRKIAIKNLISVCSTHSSLFLSEHVLKIFDDEFQGSRVEFQEVIIQGLLEFLERQEKLSGKKSGYKEKKSGKVGLDVDVFHGNSKTFENDGICASLVQRYIDPVLRLCLLEDGGISYSAVKYLKFIVIKGFCNPRLCAPTVIALQASPVHYIRSVGLELFADLFERYESLIDTSYAQGFKEAIEFRSKLTKNILLETSSFLQKFYTIVEDSKSSKKKMMNQLVKSFQFDVNSISVEDCESFQNYVLFIAMNLAECEFNFYEEVFIIIDGIQPILFNEGMALAKLISQRGDLLKQPEDNPEAENDLKLGYICAILITFERLLTCLRHSYRIHETTEKTNELKAQRTKIQKQKMKLIKFTPGDSEVNTFVAHFNSIKL